jgi:nicotinamidase-related amidase
MAAIQKMNRKHIIIAGIEAHVCVLQTVIDLSANGFEPVVVADCISSRKEKDKMIALERMKNEGAVISSCESILFELCRVSGNEKFKAISALVK